MSQTDLDNQGFYKLSWVQRIGFGVGDTAQNLIYQVIAGYATWFYTDVYVIGTKEAEKANKIKPAAVASAILLIARIMDVIWDPFVGAFVDKSNPKFGKYRSWLLYGGLPLTLISIASFWSGLADTSIFVSIAYAAVTYIVLQMLYTVVNVPYGAINASLTRDTHEITMLTSVRMVCANIGGFFVWVLMPMFVSLVEGKAIPWGLVAFNFVGSIPGILFMPFVPAIKKIIGKKNMFYIFGTISIIGYALLYFFSRSESITKGDIEHNPWIVIANFIKALGFTTITGYMWAIVPEVISYAEYTTGRRIAGIVNALTGMFFKAGNAIGGAIPGLILAWTDYDRKREPPAGSTMSTDRFAWFIVVLIYSIIGLALLIFCFTQSKEKIVMDEKETKNVKYTDLFVEFVRNGPLRVIALYFITAFCCMTTHNQSVNYLYKINTQEKKPQEGIRWMVAVIPIILNIIMIIIISFYSLTDEKMQEIERENEKRLHKNDDLA